jgi:hypothetical protein
MPKNRKGTEVEIFVWVGGAEEDASPLYSVSRGHRGVCVDLPLESALLRIRAELEAADIQRIAA